jgi:hypothetical protein
MEATSDWSTRIIDFAGRNQLGILDFHGWLAPTMRGMVRGEYPGSEAQQILASRVGEALGLTLPSSCPVEMQPNSMSPYIDKILRKAQRWLDNRLCDFPGLVR